MSLIDKFISIRVLCIGDVMLDRFINGDVKRISPESPVPVISISKTMRIPGGAANVARNICSLSAQCTLVGLVGNDEAGRELVSDLQQVAGLSVKIVESNNRSTTEKTRYVAQGQHILRADIECVEKLSLELEDKLLGVISSVVRGHDVIVLSDYAKGVLTDRVIGATINAARELSIPIIVDPKSEQLERYAGATLVTPNSRELFAATGLDPALDDETAAAAGYSVLQRMDIRSLLVTRAEKGMTLITRGSDPVHISSTAREVSDVVGAGDTVIAALSLAIGAGGGLPEAASLANLAAGIVVGKRGTATVTRTELLAALAERNRFSEGIVETHLLSLQDVGSRTDLWRRDGLKIGFTNGCFDILHVGHIKLLNFARSHCDRLIVGLNSDASARRLKGPTRPINSQSDRAYLIAALNMVDAVILFDQDTPLNLIEEIKPDVLVKGADYTLQQIVGAEFVLKRGGTVLRCDLVPDRSTTKTLGEIVAGDSP